MFLFSLCHYWVPLENKMNHLKGLSLKKLQIQIISSSSSPVCPSLAPLHNQVCSFCFLPVLWMLLCVSVCLSVCVCVCVCVCVFVSVSDLSLTITCCGIIKVLLGFFVFVILPNPTHRTVTEYRTKRKLRRCDLPHLFTIFSSFFVLWSTPLDSWPCSLSNVHFTFCKWGKVLFYSVLKPVHVCVAAQTNDALGCQKGRSGHLYKSARSTI